MTDVCYLIGRQQIRISQIHLIITKIVVTATRVTADWLKCATVTDDKLETRLSTSGAIFQE